MATCPWHFHGWHCVTPCSHLARGQGPELLPLLANTRAMEGGVSLLALPWAGNHTLHFTFLKKE